MSGQRKYSVFLGNVGSCSDRYCGAYGPEFSTAELLRRVDGIKLVSGVDLVLTPELLEDIDLISQWHRDSGTAVVSVAVDHFARSVWKQGSFSAGDPEVRRLAVADAVQAMDIAAELGCDMITIWPGQDGYDYLFQADYETERNWFADGVREVCRHRSDVRVSLEYKCKEPRNHCYVSSAASTLLLIQEIGEDNCGAVLDYGHALIGYENPAESVALLQHFGRRLMHVHINDNYRLWDDDMIVGSVHTLEFLEFFYWLRRTGYTGWMTIDQYPYREDGQQAVAESAAWLDTLESLLDRVDPEEIAEVLHRKDAIASSRLMRKILMGG